MPETDRAKKVRKDRNAVPETPIVERVIMMARAGRVSPLVQCAPFPQSSPTIRAEIKMKFLLWKRCLNFVSVG
jgi:hypothetical protein